MRAGRARVSNVGIAVRLKLVESVSLPVGSLEIGASVQ